MPNVQLLPQGPLGLFIYIIKSLEGLESSLSWRKSFIVCPPLFFKSEDHLSDIHGWNFCVRYLLLLSAHVTSTSQIAETEKVYFTNWCVLFPETTDSV